MKKCKSPNCKSLRPKFNKDKSKLDGFSTICKECRKIQQKRNREKNKILKSVLFTKTCDLESCNISFETTIYNKKYCCQRHTNKSMRLRQEEEAGGRFKFQSIQTAKRRISVKNAKNHNKRFSDKDLKILNMNISTSKKAELIGKSPENIRRKIGLLKKEKAMKIDWGNVGV